MNNPEGIKALVAKWRAEAAIHPIETADVYTECADELESLTAVAGDAEAFAWGRWAEGLPPGTRLMRYDGVPLVNHEPSEYFNVPLYTRQAVEGMVPDGWRVIPFGGSFGRGKWEVYAPCGSGGAVDEDDVRHFAVRMLLDSLAAAAPQAGKGDERG